MRHETWLEWSIDTINPQRTMSARLVSTYLIMNLVQDTRRRWQERWTTRLQVFNQQQWIPSIKGDTGAHQEYLGHDDAFENVRHWQVRQVPIVHLHGKGLVGTMHTSNGGNQVLMRNQGTLGVPRRTGRVAKSGNRFGVWRRVLVASPSHAFSPDSFHLGKGKNFQTSRRTQLGCIRSYAIHQNGRVQARAITTSLGLAELCEFRSRANDRLGSSLMKDEMDGIRSESIVKGNSRTSDSKTSVLCDNPFHAVLHVQTQATQTILIGLDQIESFQASRKGIDSGQTLRVTTVNVGCRKAGRAHGTESKAGAERVDGTAPTKGFVHCPAAVVAEFGMNKGVCIATNLAAIVTGGFRNDRGLKRHAFNRLGVVSRVSLETLKVQAIFAMRGCHRLVF